MMKYKTTHYINVGESEFEDSADDEEWQHAVGNDRGPIPIPLTATQGSHQIPPNTARPIDYFNL